MPVVLFFLFTFFTCSVFAATWKKTSTTPVSSISSTAGMALTSAQCPDNYIFIPKLYSYTVSNFCVAKYEMKNDGYGMAVSQVSGAPWASVDRPTARSACQALGKGYDMISNDQWQTIARNIAATAINWNTGIVASGELNRGHWDGVPNNSLSASSDDVNGNCSGTGQSCSSSVWDSQRRTHVLSNGSVIWDFAGNVLEWVTNNSNVANGADGYMSTMSSGDVRQNRYGAASGTICATPSVSPYCGMGHGWFNYTAGSVLRGGYWGSAYGAGIFVAYLGHPTSYTNANIGFRCVYVP